MELLEDKECVHESPHNVAIVQVACCIMPLFLFTGVSCVVSSTCLQCFAFTVNRKFNYLTVYLSFL